MQKTTGLILTIAGGVLAAALFIVMASVNFKAGGAVALITAIFAALFALFAVAVGILGQKDERLMQLLAYLSCLLGLILFAMLPTFAYSIMPFWVLAGILLTAAGAKLCTGPEMDFSDEREEEFVLDVPNIIMISAAALAVIFILVGLITAPVKMKKSFPKAHLINTIFLLLTSMAGLAGAIFSLVKRSLVKPVGMLITGVAMLAVTQTMGLYGFNGFVVMFSAVAAAAAAYIAKTVEAEQLRPAPAAGTDVEEETTEEDEPPEA